MLDTVDASSMLCRLEMEGKLQSGVVIHDLSLLMLKEFLFAPAP